MNTTILLPEQKESTRHGEILFPVQKYTTSLTPKNPLVVPHWHEEAEFTLLLEGTCTYQIQLENYSVQPGDLIFVAPFQLHSVTPKTDSLTSDTFVFHMNYLGAGNNDACSMRYLTPIVRQKLIPPAIIHPQNPSYEEALALFHQITHAWSLKNPGYELTIKSALLTLIALFLPYCVESSEHSARQAENTQKIKNALEYIDLHYTENISIADVAATCYLSEYYFMRFFKKHIGMTCVDYIKNLRLEKSIELFKSGETSILDVSIAAGFHNLAYFYRAFKKKYGMTPKQYLSQLPNKR